MGRRHPRVRRVKLVCQSFLNQEAMDRVDPVGGDQRRAVTSLGDEIPQRATDRAGHADGLIAHRHQCKLPVDPTDFLRLPLGDEPPGFVDGHIIDQVPPRIGQVDDPLDRLMLVHRIVTWSRKQAPLSPHPTFRFQIAKALWIVPAGESYRGCFPTRLAV